MGCWPTKASEQPGAARPNDLAVSPRTLSARAAFSRSALLQATIHGDGGPPTEGQPIERASASITISGGGAGHGLSLPRIHSESLPKKIGRRVRAFSVTSRDACDVTPAALAKAEQERSKTCYKTTGFQSVIGEVAS